MQSCFDDCCAQLLDMFPVGGNVVVHDSDKSRAVFFDE